MPHISTELSTEWLNYARASLGARIEDTEHITAKVLTAVQAIATQLDEKQELQALLNFKSNEAVPSEILPLLQNLLKHLDSQDTLSQLIAPLYTSLQFEDRTRQKLEGLLEIMSIWAKVRNTESMSDKDLATAVMEPIVSLEQQEILAKYFPDYIQIEEADDEIELF